MPRDLARPPAPGARAALSRAAAISLSTPATGWPSITKHPEFGRREMARRRQTSRVADRLVFVGTGQDAKRQSRGRSGVRAMGPTTARSGAFRAFDPGGRMAAAAARARRSACGRRRRRRPPARGSSRRCRSRTPAAPCRRPAPPPPPPDEPPGCGSGRAGGWCGRRPDCRSASRPACGGTLVLPRITAPARLQPRDRRRRRVGDPALDRRQAPGGRQAGDVVRLLHRHRHAEQRRRARRAPVPRRPPRPPPRARSKSRTTTALIGPSSALDPRDRRLARARRRSPRRPRARRPVRRPSRWGSDRECHRPSALPSIRSAPVAPERLRPYRAGFTDAQPRPSLAAWPGDAQAAEGTAQASRAISILASLASKGPQSSSLGDGRPERLDLVVEQLLRLRPQRNRRSASRSRPVAASRPTSRARKARKASPP